jgi:predicted dehydrogenase
MSRGSLGVAVIGAGMAGRAHAAGYRTATTMYDDALPNVRLVAIADVMPELAADTARRYGYERSETTWQAIAEAADIDVVSVAVSNPWHREVVEGLLDAGKHVLCEKPLADNVEDAAAMVAAAARSAQETAAGFVKRRIPAVAGIRAEIDKGHIGQPVHLSARYWIDFACDPELPMNWRFQGPPGSGALADQGSHLVDLAEFLCGPIASVQGATLATLIRERRRSTGPKLFDPPDLSSPPQAVENEDVALVNVTFASGAVGSLSLSRVATGLPNALGFELFTEAGGATFDLHRTGEFGFIDGAPGAVTQGYRQVLVGPDQPYIGGGLPLAMRSVNHGLNDLFVFQARSFLEQVVGVDNLPRCASFEDGLRAAQILEAIVASAASGAARIDVKPST